VSAVRRRLDAKQLRKDLSDPRGLCASLGYIEKARPQQGGGLFIRCPAHLEKTPSCSVTVGLDGTIRVRCFSCGFTGDALHLVALARGLDIKRDFLAVLMEAASITRDPVFSKPPRIPRAVRPQTPLEPEQLDKILKTLLSLCPLTHETSVCSYLLSRPSGRALLTEARRAGWGAVPSGSAGQKVAKKLYSLFGQDGLAPADIGISLGSPVFIHPHHRLLIPFYSPTGLLHTIQRRRLNDRTPKYVFPRGFGAQWPYGLEELSHMTQDTSVVLVEGAIDTLERRAKYRAANANRLVLGLPGVASWKAEWAIFARDREARIGLDTDWAGEQAVPTLIRDLWQAGSANVLRTTPVDGRKDWNSLQKGTR